MKKWLVTVGCLFSLIGTADAADADELRFRVLAHSDSAVDQQVKHEVYDTVLTLVSEEMATRDSWTYDELTGALYARLEEWEQTVNDGLPYDAVLELKAYHFPEKVKDGVIYPETVVDTLLVTLGDGAGANGWCLLFPGYCSEITAAAGEPACGEEADEPVKVESFLVNWTKAGWNWLFSDER